MSKTIQGYGANFFPDQHVAAADLNMIEYSKTKLLRDYFSGMTKTPGVLTSNIATDTALQVTATKSTVSTTSATFDVNPGIAVDNLGRIIYVPAVPTQVSGSLNADPLYHPANPGRTNLAVSDYVIPGVAINQYVNLYYATIEGSVETDDAGNTYPTRVYDSYAIRLEPTLATDGITLARLTTDTAGDNLVVSDATNDPLTAGYFDGINRWSILDYRPAFEFKSSGYTQLAATVTENTTDLEEMLDKTVTISFPSSGQEYYTYFPRNVALYTFKSLIATKGLPRSAKIYLYSGTSIQSATTPVAWLELSNTYNEWRWMSLDPLQTINQCTPETMLRLVFLDVNPGIDYISVKIEYRRR